MKSLFKILFPALLVVAAFYFAGPLFGFLFLLAMIIYYIFKNMPMIYLMIGKFNYLKDNEKMFAYLEKSYQTGRMKPDQKIYYGYMCMRERKYDKAERLFNDAMAFQKDEGVLARAKTNQALLMWKKGDLNGAVELMGEVFEGYKSAVVYGNYGYLLILKNDLKKALEINLEGYDYDNTNDVICDNLVQNYYLLGDYEKSREYATQLMERNPQFPIPYYNYAKTLIALGEKDEAEEMLKKALNFPFSAVAEISKEEVENLLLSLQ